LCFQENFEKEIASQENAQFSVCQAEKTGAKVAALENQQDIKVQLKTAIVFSSKCFCGDLHCVIIFILYFFLTDSDWHRQLLAELLVVVIFVNASDRC